MLDNVRFVLEEEDVCTIVDSCAQRVHRDSIGLVFLLVQVGVLERFG